MIAANARRYPVSAQCEILGVARATYYYMVKREDAEPKLDPLEDEVVSIFHENRGRYGARRIRAVLARRGKVASRRRIGRILKTNNLACIRRNSRPKDTKRTPVNEAALPNVVDRVFNGYEPRTHICSDLTYVRVGNKWCYICLLVDLYNREIVGHGASERKDARLVKSAFATLDFPISDIEVFHTDRGSEFDNAQIDEMLEVFGINRSLSKKGCPYDNAVDESTNKTLKEEFVYQETFSSLHDLQVRLSNYVHWYNHRRLHSTLGYMSPVEFREAGLSL